MFLFRYFIITWLWSLRTLFRRWMHMMITTTCLLPVPNCVVRNMMAAFQSVSKQFLRERSFPEGTFFSPWRTRIQISSGSPILLRYYLSSFIFISFKPFLYYKVANADKVKAKSIQVRSHSLYVYSQNLYF